MQNATMSPSGGFEVKNQTSPSREQLSDLDVKLKVCRQYRVELATLFKESQAELTSLCQRQENAKASKLVFVDRMEATLLEIKTERHALTVEALVGQEEKLRKIREELESRCFDSYTDDYRFASGWIKCLGLAKKHRTLEKRIATLESSKANFNSDLNAL